MDEADQSGRTPETDQRRIEFLLKLNSDRVNGLEGALERNWIAHLISDRVTYFQYSLLSHYYPLQKASTRVQPCKRIVASWRVRNAIYREDDRDDSDQREDRATIPAALLWQRLFY